MKRIVEITQKRLSLLIFAGGLLMSAKPAHSMMLVSGTNTFLNYGDTGYNNFDTNKILLCVVFLPVCVLKDKAPNAPVSLQKNSAYSRARTLKFLLANGYTPAEANSLIGEAKNLLDGAIKKHRILAVSKSDTHLTISRDIKFLYPKASADFIEFYTNEVFAKPI